MSLSGSSGQELNRATMYHDLGTGGSTADVDRSSATEDREIVALQWSKSAAAGFAQLSFSTANTLQTNDDDNTKSSVLATMGGTNGTVYFDDPIHWDSGEELHLHKRNNSGASVFTAITVYYREV